MITRQCRELGLVVGDTIIGREIGGFGWKETKLTLLWIGDEVAVWREQERNEHQPEWSTARESANWDLSWRGWHKMPNA